MTLNEARNQLSAYLDDELDGATRRAVDEALAAHPELRAELEALRRTSGLVRGLPRHRAPDDLADRVMARVQAPSRPGLLSRWGGLLAAAAAALVVAFAGWFAFRTTGPRTAARDVRSESSAPTAPASSARTLSEEALAYKTGEMDEGRARPKAKPEAPRLGMPAKPKRPDAPREQVEPAFAAKAKTDGPAAPAPGTEARGSLAQAPPADRRLRRAAKGAAATERPRKVRRGPAVAGKQLAPEQAETPLGTGHRGRDERSANALADAHDDLVASILEPRHGGPAINAQLSIQHEGRGGAGVARGEPRAEAEETAAPSEPAPTVDDYNDGFAGGEDAGTARVVSGRFVYDDLQEALAGAQTALRDADVSFAIQPLGSGRFVIEADLPAPEARALLARLDRPHAEGREAEAKRLAPMRAPEPALKSKPEPAPRPEPEPAPETTARTGRRTGRAAGQPATVHLILHFRPGRPAPAEAAPVEQAPAGQHE